HGGHLVTHRAASLSRGYLLAIPRGILDHVDARTPPVRLLWRAGTGRRRISRGVFPGRSDGVAQGTHVARRRAPRRWRRAAHAPLPNRDAGDLPRSALARLGGIPIRWEHDGD